MDGTARKGRAAERQAKDPAFARWAKGHGAIAHTEETQEQVLDLEASLQSRGLQGDGVPLLDLLHALDRVTAAAMWLVVHQTYAARVRTDGAPLQGGDFKEHPDGHTGGSLNMVPAYAGYLAANALTGTTRSWLMGQGHCVAAIDCVNLLVGNLGEAHAARYAGGYADEPLTRYVRDFYSYRLDARGRPESPLGSHVNAHTAGGVLEGGYLGFAEIGYAHMALPGESLVAFLSDGAFEEQRGSDWSPRWFRADDSGYAIPIMIANGRRIDQRTTMSQQGGVAWFERHLELNGFEPFSFDGRDPAAFAAAIVLMEERLAARAREAGVGKAPYPVRLPHGVAVAPKGAGFPGEGTNLAHNLPLQSSPRKDPEAAARFNQGAGRLHVPADELRAAASLFVRHRGRPRERDHAIATRDVAVARPREMPFVEVDAARRKDPGSWERRSPMAAADRAFVAILAANPGLRPRVGNPDEMKSNRLVETLERLRFRVTDPEPGLPESTSGSVVTALNEEAVAAAALANKGGLSLFHTYEAFAPKMLGIIRQEVIFARHLKKAGRPPGWASVPLLLTSHTWENGKNEQSHQDPTLAEALFGEGSDTARVLFVADHNTAVAAIEACYATRAQVWAIVAPKVDAIPSLFTPDEARALVRDGGLALDWAAHAAERAELVIAAAGAYQLGEVLRASRRLAERGLPHTVVYLMEPARFRAPRDEAEAAHTAPASLVAALFPERIERRLFVSHTRPEPLLGLLGPLHTGRRTSGLGYVGRGGTLDTPGMLFVNRATWAHVASEAARLCGRLREDVLAADEIEALDGRRSPHGVVIPEPRA